MTKNVWLIFGLLAASPAFAQTITTVAGNSTWGLVYNVTSGVGSPKDLEGKKVGVRAYTVTTGVWARGLLATDGAVPPATRRMRYSRTQAA